MWWSIKDHLYKNLGHFEFFKLLFLIFENDEQIMKILFYF
jgi:hypothetical protein